MHVYRSKPSTLSNQHACSHLANQTNFFQPVNRPVGVESVYINTVSVVVLNLIEIYYIV